MCSSTKYTYPIPSLLAKKESNTSIKDSKCIDIIFSFLFFNILIETDLTSETIV